MLYNICKIEDINYENLLLFGKLLKADLSGKGKLNNRLFCKTCSKSQAGEIKQWASTYCTSIKTCFNAQKPHKPRHISTYL